jgi:hypothetical protein
MRPKMTNKKARVNSLVFILPKALDTIKESCPQCPTEKNLRALIEQAGGNNAFKSLFSGTSKKVSCVAVPRNTISRDVLQALDGCE